MTHERFEERIKAIGRGSRPDNSTLDNGGGPPHDGNMEHRLTALETRFDTILPTLATKADVGEILTDMQKMNAEIKTWTLATMITIIGTMLAAIFGISQIYKTASSPVASPAPIIIQIPSQPPPQTPAK
jgi:hypothetical protein